MKNPRIPTLIGFCIISLSHAQDTNSDLSLSPSSSIPTTFPSIEPSEAPSAVPSTSLKPTATSRPTIQPTLSITESPTSERCANHPNFFLDHWHHYNCTWNLLNLTCDNELVTCYDYGNLGPATEYCCKCKKGCQEQCGSPISTAPPPDDDYCYVDYYDNDCYNCGLLGDIPSIVITIMAICGLAGCARVIYNHQGRRPARRREVEENPERHAVQQTMTARRQRQRQNNAHGLSEEERNNERFELFVTKFYFQTILPGMSNVTAESIRNPTNKADDEEQRQNSEDVGLADRLSSWRSPSAKDECCICLEGYSEGETICAPITKSCDHVFHEGCILEWLKTNDHCPLCRCALLSD